MILDDLEALARAAHREPWDYWDWASWEEGTGDQTGHWQPAPYTERENAALVIACSPERILALVAVAKAAADLNMVRTDGRRVAGGVAQDLRDLRAALAALDAP